MPNPVGERSVTMPSPMRISPEGSCAEYINPNSTEGRGSCLRLNDCVKEGSPFPYTTRVRFMGRLLVLLWPERVTRVYKENRRRFFSSNVRAAIFTPNRYPLTQETWLRVMQKGSFIPGRSMKRVTSIPGVTDRLP